MILKLTLGIFTIYRISHMVAHEAGPFNVFGKLRHLADKISPKETIHAPDMVSISVAKTGSFYAGLTCTACNSVWFSMILSIFLVSNFLEWFLFSFSISAGVILLTKVINSNDFSN